MDTIFWAVWRTGVGFDIEIIETPVVLNDELMGCEGICIRLPLFEIVLGRRFELEEE